MSEQIDDEIRRIVPRWRPSMTAAHLGELDSAFSNRTARSPVPARGEVEGLIALWESGKTAQSARALVDAGIVLDRPTIAEPAARWLLEHVEKDSTTYHIAQSLLKPMKSSVPTIIGKEQRYRTIAMYRRWLRAEPRNAMLWVDLAREYSVIGQNTQAAKALDIATALAPTDRFVLRSASRFYLHAGEFDRAHDILMSTARVKRDPWLVAAEIAAADIAGRTSSLVALGRRFVESGSFNGRQVSELASALGSLELAHGKRRHARKLFRNALRDPTENSVAQAVWAARRLSDFEVPAAGLSAPFAFEANAWEAVTSGQYAEALELGKLWVGDEPFARRSVVFASWIAGIVLGEYETALAFTQLGLAANPEDTRLLSNEVYYLASLGRINDAEAKLEILENRTSGQDDFAPNELSVLLEADRGLIEFRRGQLDKGRMHYQRALRIAQETNIPRWGAGALINYAREESLANSAVVVDSSTLERALSEFPSWHRAALEQFLKRHAIIPMSLG